jgi:putative heme degradation protein
MPRDLLAERDQKALDGMPQLARESASSQGAAPSTQDLVEQSTPFVEERFKKMKDIHPFAQLLNHEDLDDCDWLEHAAFDPIEAASREKVSDCCRQFHVRFRSPSQFVTSCFSCITIGLLPGV